MSEIVLALRDVVQVNPWLATLWFLSALILGGLIVYGWRRLAGLQ
jgi:hypothetical protein